MQDAAKAVWSIPYVSVAFFPSLKQNFITYRSSKVPDCIFEIHQQWQSGFSRVYFKCCCSCSFEPEIIKIGQSSHKTYSNNIVNFQESTTILNAHTKKVWKLIVCPSYITMSPFSIPANCSVIAKDWSQIRISNHEKENFKKFPFFFPENFLFRKLWLFALTKRTLATIIKKK